MSAGSQVCVLGAGLIGGSLLRAVGPESAFGWNRSAPTVDAASAAGFEMSTDLPGTLRRAVERDALVVVGVPLPALGAVLDAVAEHAPTVALTDVVSVKQPVLDAVHERGLGTRFVGGHPMAGTAHSGWAATDADLFRGATWFVSADSGADPDTWSRVARLAGSCGSRVISSTSAEHDAAVARVSHLGHVLAEALALAGGRGGDLALALAAGSFRDGTRVAGTAPGLVRAICEPNRDALLAVLDDCLADLGQARRALAGGGTLGPLVDDGHAARLAYETVATKATAAGNTLEVAPGEPGWLDALREAGARGQAVRPAD